MTARHSPVKRFLREAKAGRPQAFDTPHTVAVVRRRPGPLPFLIASAFITVGYAGPSAIPETGMGAASGPPDLAGAAGRRRLGYAHRMAWCIGNCETGQILVDEHGSAAS